MRVSSRTLDVRKFEKDFSSLIRLRDDKETVINDVVARVNAAKANIVTFLKDVDGIEDEKVQKSCRCAAIAQMYNVKPKYAGYPYIEQQAYGNVFLIEFKHDKGERPVYSTAVVSRHGEIIIDEGEILVSSMTNCYGSGWFFKRVDGEKYGFISDYGEVLIPCFFDRCYTNVGIAFCFLKSISFELTVYGKQEELDNKWIKQIIRAGEKPECLICRSESGVLYTLSAEKVFRDPSNGVADYDCEVDPIVYQEAQKEVKEFMSPYFVSQEELKRLLEE